MGDVGACMKVAVVGLLALFAAAPTAEAAVVALFANDAYVPTGPGSEVENVHASLSAENDATLRFTDITTDGMGRALAGMDAVVIPEQENGGNLTADLGPAGREAYREFVRDGSTLVIDGEANGRAATFLNGVFDLGVDEQDTASAYALDAAVAADTEFEGGPASLPDQPEVTGLTRTSLPAGTKALYANDTHAGVALFHYGAGSIVFLGWDWQGSDPAWQNALGRSVDAPIVQASSGNTVEGDAGVRPLTFTAALSNPASEVLTVDYEIVLYNAAAAPFGAMADDVAPPLEGRLTFPRGATSQSFVAHVIGDRLFEEDETFEVRLNPGRNVDVRRPQLGTGFGRIVNDDLAPGRCANRQTGTHASEALYGTGAGDLIFGLGGNDTIWGGSKDDCLRGGAGNDKLDGDDHADSLSGEAGHDRLFGRDGADNLLGGDGNDTLNGGAGRNSYKGGAGNDRISARNGVGRERINCGSGARDRATVDRTDRVSGCESVSRR